MKNRRWLSRVFLIFGLGIGGLILYWLIAETGWQNLFDSLSLFGLLPLLGFIAISLLNFCFYTWRWKLILDDMMGTAKRIPFGRLFMHRMSGFAAGYLTPAAQVAGEPVRVALLRGDGIELQPATSSVVLDLAFEILSFTVYVIAGLGLAFGWGLGVDGSLLWPTIMILVIFGMLMTFFGFTIRGVGFFHRLISALGLRRFEIMKRAEIWMQETEKLMTKFFDGNSGKIFGVVGLSFVMTAFRAIEVGFIAYFLGTGLDLGQAIIMSTLPGMALFLPIPGGLGVFEGSNVAAFALLGLAVNPVAFTLIVRARDLLFIAIGVVHAVFRGERLLSRRA